MTIKCLTIYRTAKRPTDQHRLTELPTAAKDQIPAFSKIE